MSENLYLDNLKRVLTRKIDIKDPSKFRLFLVGAVLALLVLIFFFYTADFNKIQQQSVQGNPPPPPPVEIMNEGSGQEQTVLGNISNLTYWASPSPMPPPSSPPKSTPTPSPYPTGVIYPYDLKVNLDMGCGGSIYAQSVLFSWKQGVQTNWRLYVTDNNWQTLHSSRRFQISGDRTYLAWSKYNPMDDGYAPTFGKYYKWRVSNGMMTVPGPDFRSPLCPTPIPTPTPTPIKPSPTPTPWPSATPTTIPTPWPPGCTGPLKIISVNLMKFGYQQYVYTQVDNLTNCDGIVVWVVIYTDQWNWQACQVSGKGCSTRHLAPKAGTYSILAVADLDKDGNWYEPGEYDKRTLTVTPNP